jgi:hypothetical protein
MFRFRRSVVITSVVLAVATALMEPVPFRASVKAIQAPSGVVYAQGTQLMLDGAPYHFKGLNIYNANSRWNCADDMQTTGYLATSLQQLAPVQNAFRAWFFQREAVTNGALDFTAFDNTLALAKQYNMRVIVTLADEGGTCDSGGYKGLAWYQSGYESTVQSPDVETYDAYVHSVVSRYAGNPNILMWQLMNEAQDCTRLTSDGSGCASGGCDEQLDAAALQQWATTVGGEVHAIDPTHLVNVGTLGGELCGENETSEYGNTGLTDYAALYSVPNIDVCEVHDYGAPALGLPNDATKETPVEQSIDQCAALNKPIFVGEIGMTGDAALAAGPPSPNELPISTTPSVSSVVAESGQCTPAAKSSREYEAAPVQYEENCRAADFENKLTAQFEHGSSGELLWGWCYVAP